MDAWMDGWMVSQGRSKGGPSTYVLYVRIRTTYVYEYLRKYIHMCTTRRLFRKKNFFNCFFILSALVGKLSGLGVMLLNLLWRIDIDIIIDDDEDRKKKKSAGY